jgi:hypothetical protein
MHSFTFTAKCGHEVTETINDHDWRTYYAQWYDNDATAFLEWRATMICPACAKAIVAADRPVR